MPQGSAPMPQPARVREGEELPASEQTHYTLLGVSEEATVEDLKAAYHQKSLTAHPDKGGDADDFHEIEQAYKLLEDPKRREAYDEELEKQRLREELVEGLPSFKKDKPKMEVARVKTAATPGSKRQMVKQALEHTRPTCNTVMKALCDDVTQETKVEAVFQEYKLLPPPKYKKREWLSNLMGQDKKMLKKIAKEHEAEAREKAMTWLANGPSGGAKNLTEADAKEKARKSEAEARQAARQKERKAETEAREKAKKSEAEGGEEAEKPEAEARDDAEKTEAEARDDAEK